MPNNMKTIYIHDKEALEWYNKQDNKYQYLTDLIIKDKREKEKYISKEEINDLITNAIHEILINCKVEDNQIVINKPLKEINKQEIQDIVLKKLKHGGTYIGDIDNELIKNRNGDIIR